MNILLIGATSAIVQAVGRIYANAACNIYLVGRNPASLEIVKNDLIARGAPIVLSEAVPDFTDFRSLQLRIEHIYTKATHFDIVLIGHGTLPDQEVCSTNFESFHDQFLVNFHSVVASLLTIKPLMVAQQSGTIAVIGSVAGDRGRKSNYAYGSAKGALEVFLEGFRNELFTSAVNVLTIKPGFVDTPMTASIKKGVLFATPERIATDIVSAIQKRKDVKYTPFFWFFIMLIIKLIPEKIFKRLSL
jgi:decaprenylphospho-beta-D-erythro-pentofuranosid-2-ulose 2-reductase